MRARLNCLFVLPCYLTLIAAGALVAIPFGMAAAFLPRRWALKVIDRIQDAASWVGS